LVLAAGRPPGDIGAISTNIQVVAGRALTEPLRLLGLDPFVASVRREPRYLSLTAAMTQDVAEMRKWAAAAHPSLFTPQSAPRP
jgi:hypothetical protein